MAKLPFEDVQWKTLVKRESATNQELGCKPQNRPVDEIINYGVVNINKPRGPTKHLASEVPIRFRTMFKEYWE